MALPRAAYNVIIGGILLHLSLGTLYTWGCIQPYVTSYIRLYDASVTTQDTTIVYACGCLGHALAAPLVGLLQFRVGFRGSAMVGVALVTLSMLACSRAKTVTELSVLYSMFGVGIAMAYTCPLVCGYAWMPDRKGMVSGLVVAGFGAGAAVFDAVATAAVNPGNASPNPTTGYYEKEVAGRVPLMFVILGTCYLFLGMVGSSMISPPPPGSLAQGTSAVYSKLASGGSSASDVSVSVAEGAASAFFGKGVHADRCEDRTEPQEQRSTPRRHVLGADRAPPVEVGAVEEEGQVGHDDLAERKGATLLPSPPSPQMQGSGRLQEHADAGMGSDVDMGSPIQGAIELGGSGCAHSQGGALVKGGGGGGVTPQRQFKVLDLLGERDYYHLALSMMLTSVSGLYIAGGYKRIAQQIFPDADRFLSILGSVASLCNASGRILGGLAVDRFGCFPTLVVMSSSMTCALLSLGLVEASRPSFFATVCLVHMLYGSNFAIYPTLTAEFFGVTSAGPNFGLVFMAYGLGAFASMLFLTKINHSSEVFLACAGISLSGASSVALLWSRRWRGGLIRHDR